MEGSNVDAFTLSITKILEYLGCQQSNYEKVFRQVWRPVFKAKGAGDCTLPFRRKDEHMVRLCNDEHAVFNVIQACKDIPDLSKEWFISVSSCQIVDNAVKLSFNRSEAFKKIIHDVMNLTENYGLSKCQKYARLRFAANSIEELSDLSEVRVSLAAKLSGNLLQAAGYDIEVNPGDIENRKADLDLYFTHKSSDSSAPIESKFVTCGVVLNTDTGRKEKQLMVHDYFVQWKQNIIRAYQEKYSDTSTELSDTEIHIAKSGVLFDLLGVKLSNCVFLSSSVKGETHNCYGVNSKGAPFVLYNTARLASIHREFQSRVTAGKYPELPPFEQIDTSLLTYDEEWTLLFHYIARFPHVIKESLIGCDEGKPNIHVFVTFINDFCRKISIYYRRVRILTDSRSQLLPVMYARLYLLQSVEQVLHNALRILDIRPILQM